MPAGLFIDSLGKIDFCERPWRPLQPNEIRLQAYLTGIRQGYDVACLNQYAFHHPWPPAGWGVGKVLEVGHEVVEFQPDDMAHGPMPHEETPIVAAEHALPVGVLRKEFTVFMEPGLVALRAVRRSNIRFGDRAVIFGMGAIGLMALQYLRLSGARDIIAVDPLPQRVKTAKRLGAHRAIQLETSQRENALDQTHFDEVDAVFDFSGSSQCVNVARGYIGRFGDYLTTNPHYATPEERAWMEDHSVRFLPVECHTEDPVLAKVVYESLAGQRVIVWPIPCQTYPFAQAPLAYRHIVEQPDSHIKVILTYGGEQQGDRPSHPLSP